MIFIGYKDNRYCFIWYIQENTIFCSTHAIFYEWLFSRCTNSHTKEHKLYNKLLDKTSLETELLTPNSSEKDRSAPVPIPHISTPLIQNNPPTHSPLPPLSYKSTSLLSTPESKKPIVEIEELNDIDSDIEMQPPSSQQSLQSSLQTPQEGPKLRRSKYQTQIPLKEGNIYEEWEHPTNIL